MERIRRGKVIVLGNNIDTDQIYPGRYLELVDPKEIGSHCLSGVDENIAPNFVEGDIVVAGTNFGCGSSREHAPISLINMGASVVLADSFARIFFRNSINLGLPLIVCKGISSELKDGDEIEVDIEEGTVTIIETGKVIQGEKIGEYAMNILEAGGIKPLFRERKF
ncbi:MAG: 3-isopropylmalate dehydratase small subunit [Clostridiales bacterium]|nr:3-isopropylmalate dehydratase small subunit [Clostridiales bacterium]